MGQSNYTAGAAVGVDGYAIQNTPGTVGCLQSDGTNLSFQPTNLNGSSIPISGGTYTLTPAQYSVPCIIFNGTLGSAQTIVFPNQIGVWFVYCGGVTVGLNTFTFKSGTATVSALSLIGGIIIVMCAGGNSINIK